jgi:catechol 2,3-dioxygenase-like lactoylglutathione lyase family enzyme
VDYETYKKKYFIHPAPEPRFRFSGAFGATLFYQDYQEALAFYKKVLGPPAYIEGENTHGWPIGSTWLTLFPSKKGNPENVEAPFFVETPEEVDRLYEAFIAAGAQGEPPVDTLMYRPVRTALLKDPFGVALLIACWLGD